MDLIDIRSSNLKEIADSVIGVLVLYKMSLHESTTFVTLTKSLKKIQVSMDLVIYDNSPKAMIESDNTKNFKEWRIHYIHNPKNPGVSKAYNEGSKIGLELKKEWVLLLDQDTTFPIDSLITYFESVKNSKNYKIYAPYLFQKEPLVLLSPSGYKFKRGYPIKKINQINVGENSLQGKTLLSSGLLINLELFSLLGGYNERLKLDFSDFYFVNQLRKKNYVFYLINSKCHHELSRFEEASLEQSLGRFSICCEAAHYVSENSLELIQVYLYLLLRACKLSLKYKSLVFQKTLCMQLIRN